MALQSTFGKILSTREDLMGLTDTALREMVFRHGFVLLRGANLETAEFEELAARFGNHISYGFGKVLNMEARLESTESQFTNASMPLHQDAILNAETDAQFLVFRCLEAANVEGGETLLTDNRAFMANLSDDILHTLRSVQFNYRALTSGYYKSNGEENIRLAPLKIHPETGEELPHLALDDPHDPRRNYAASVEGYSEDESRAFMNRLDTCLRAPGVLHAHKWQVGDFLILDNFLVCHGRNASPHGSRRRLERIAIKARKVLEAL